MKLQICGIRFSGLVDISQPLFSEVAQSLRTYLVGEKLCRYIIFVTNIVEIIYLSINLLLVQKSCGRESLCSKWYFLSTSSIQTVNPTVDEKNYGFCWSFVLLSNVLCPCLCRVWKWPRNELINCNVMAKYLTNNWFRVSIGFLHICSECLQLD